MPDDFEIYGRRVFTHGWASVLTLLSPDGAAKIREVIGEPAGVIAHYEPGELPQFHEQREGALAALIENHKIVVLSSQPWQQLKAEIGNVAYLA